MRHIEIKKDIVPYQFYINLADELYTVVINYNNAGKLFTVSLYKDDVALCENEPILYGVRLFNYAKDVFPNIYLVAKDEAGTENTVTYDNLGVTVFLCVEE